MNTRCLFKALSKIIIMMLACAACGHDKIAETAGSAEPTAPTAQPQAASSPKRSSPVRTPTSRYELLQSRRKYRIAVLSFDASQQFGAEVPYADYVRLRISNGSDVTLPCLTLLTKRYQNGQMVGSSRAPSIPTSDLMPGDSIEYDYYPKGHLDVA